MLIIQNIVKQLMLGKLKKRKKYREKGRIKKKKRKKRGKIRRTAP